MRKVEYYCPACRKFVKEFRVEPNFYGLGTGLTGKRGLPGSGMIVKICKKCNTVLMELTEDENASKRSK